ncbi:cell filamentation protein Fic [Sulfurimonas lithotrophica]|uniref:protein adenylyltransferase n=1 Tax=Sulfurimonas lithotrophica TaxID=2590022 RepID=A0A5P8NY95_9BACT|nr:Fic family protein [Sulfurimonas lithotrophica]QFR48402.1 cell filamentation protein Fic [Sulfurimonas lithotrophica]
MKYYPPSNHIYYEDSDVPINKLNIKDLEVITEIEKELLVEAYHQLHNELDENTVFDEVYLCKIHRSIFSSLFEWGGQYRSVNISKSESMFCPYMNLDTFSKEIFTKLKNDNYLRDFEDVSKKDEFAQKLSYYMCELIVLHPFNEGNGRSLRLFFDMIVTYNGYEYIDYQQTLQNNDFITASIDCMEADCDKMKIIISNGLKKAET